MQKSKASKIITKNIIVVFLILLCCVFGILNRNFFSSVNLINLLQQMCVNALLAAAFVFSLAVAYAGAQALMQTLGK